MSLLEDFVRVSRHRSCPVCERRDWCLLSRDSETSPSQAICARVESAKRFGEAGWLHVLRNDGERRGGPPLRVVAVATPPDPRLAILADQYARSLSAPALEQLARDLGLTSESLRRFDLGWNGHAWSFPMRSEAGVVVGIALRRPDGSKFAVKGSKLGLFVPRDLSGDRLLVCEGQTDTAACLVLGFQAIGRPGANSTIKIASAVVQQLRPSEVVVVGDRDEAGRRGAVEISSALAATRAVRMILPPEGIKDAREWMRRGATAADFEAAIAAAPRVAPGVCARTGGRP